MAMAPSQNLLFFFFFSLSVVINLPYAATEPTPTAIHFGIQKNETSHLYYVSTGFGKNGSSAIVDAVIDLEGRYALWFDCTSYVSSSYEPAPCGSDRCKKGMEAVCNQCVWIPERKVGCAKDACGVWSQNPVLGYLTFFQLGQDTMRVYSTDGRYVTVSYDVSKLQFSCMDASFAERLPGDHTKGVFGFANTQFSLPSQISTSFNLVPQFALCLPSSTQNGLGDVFIGGGPYYMPPSLEDRSSSLSITPLLMNPINNASVYSGDGPTPQYFIGVKDIEVGGKRIALNSSLLSFDKVGGGGTTISTILPYTTLHPSILKPLIEDFTKAAVAKNMKRVNYVAPFEACFDSNTAPKTTTGPGVPEIDLVVEGNINPVRLTLYGSNSMVEAKKNVICLAFVGGAVEGIPPAIVLGGHQLEDRLQVFDLSTSKLGFTPSLLL